MAGKRFLLLAASRGFGGGIERACDAVQDALDGHTVRVDLYRAGRETQASGNWKAKARFAVRALSAAVLSRPNVLICLHAGLLPVAVGVGAVTRTPTMLVAYGGDVWPKMSPFRRRLVAACAKRFAISQFTADWLVRRARLPANSVQVVPLPIAPSLASLSQASEVPLPGETIALSVARVSSRHRYKGLVDVLEAWPLVTAEIPRARWVVVGDGDDLPALKARAHELRVADSIVFAGSVSDAALAEHYRRAQVFVLPSVADPTAIPPMGEGFGLVYAEAGAFGVPSIASTASGGASDYVRDMETGLTVVPGDSEGLAEAILLLLQDHELRRRLGESARSETIANHLPETFNQRFAMLVTT